MQDEIRLASMALQMAVGAQWMSLLFLTGLEKALTDNAGFTNLEVDCLHSMRLSSMFFALPFFTWLSNIWNRKGVLVLGLFISSLFTIFTSLVQDYRGMMVLNIFSGFFLGGIIPTTRSLIASYFPLEERGTHYGLVELSSGLGGFLGAGMTVAFGDNWRGCFIAIGLLQLPLVLGCSLWVKDYKPDPPLKRNTLRVLFEKEVFVTQLWQGCFGAFPWSSLPFLMFWLEKMGIQKKLSILIFASVGIGAAVGGILGGALGDAVNKKYPAWGRIAVSHTSVLSGIFWSCLLLQAVPHHKENWSEFATVGGLMGLMISWAAANQSANLTDIFPPELHTTMFAVQFWPEGLISSLSPVVFGFFNEFFFKAGEITPRGGASEWESFSEEKKQRLLQGYANSLTLLCCLFWFLCQIGYFKMYCHYPRESISLNSQSPI